MKFSKEIRLIIYNKFDKKCAYCGKFLEINQMQVDHIIPYYHSLTNINHRIKILNGKIGTNDVDNLNPSCARCNRWKSNFTLEMFREEIQLQTKRLNNHNNNYRLAKDFGMIIEDNKPVKFYFEIYNENK